MGLCTATKTTPRRRASDALAASALAASLMLATSCADWPEELDPSDWYGAIVGEDAASSPPEPLPGAEDDYPVLSDVPEAPEDVPTSEEMDRIAESLADDFADARAAGDAVRADDGDRSLVARSERDDAADAPDSPDPSRADGSEMEALESAAVEPAAPADAAGGAAFADGGDGFDAETLAAVIRFGHGSSELGAEERRIVARLAAAHAQAGGRIRLVGHASRAAGAAIDADRVLVNFGISLDRATAVAEELIRNGTPRDAILIEAAGDGRSMAAAAGVENEAVDRRVEVFFGAR